MSEDDLAALKARRDMDRLTLMDRLAEARELANPKVLAERARVDVENRARSAAAQVVEIANDHRGVVAATASALILWGMRNHMGQKLAGKLGSATAGLGRGLFERALPALIAPLTTPLIGSLVVPALGLARRAFFPGKQDGPTES